MLGLSKYSDSNQPEMHENDKRTSSDDSHCPGPLDITRRKLNREIGCVSSGSEYDLVMDNSPFIKTVEWEMLDKNKFFPMSMMSSFTVRTMLYPLTLIRTRLQVQKGKEVYSGTFDAGRKILHSEGFRGLYRGFFVSAFQIVSGLCYISTYEGVRYTLEQNNITNKKVKAFVGGACASIVGQTIIVPFDVISQYIMLIGQKDAQAATQSTVKSHASSSQSVRNATAAVNSSAPNCSSNTLSNEVPKSTKYRPSMGHASISFFNPLGIHTEGRSKAQIAGDITVAIYRKDGFKGYYRGYFASVSTYVPSSASWWTFYQFFQDFYGALIPLHEKDVGFPNTMVQCAAAMSSGCASCLITNPLDLTRTRVQVHRRSFRETVRTLWHEEGLKIFTKGLSARMTSSVIYSVAIIFGYETVKKWSVLDEYKDKIMW